MHAPSREWACPLAWEDSCCRVARHLSVYQERAVGLLEGPAQRWFVGRAIWDWGAVTGGNVRVRVLQEGERCGGVSAQASGRKEYGKQMRRLEG
jgi:hypothetical protein